MRKRKSTYRHGVEQTPVSRLTVKELLRSAAFVRGFTDAQKGVPFDYDIYCDNLSNRWKYERGRVLGLIWSGPLKIGQKVSAGAQVAASNAWLSREMV